MSRETDEAVEAVEVLRAIWTAGGQSAADLEDAFGTARSCKSMQAVGFDDPEDLRDAWRATLAREGKLSRGGTVRDLVLGPGGDGDPEDRR
jgi:hypothetical protein